MTGRKAIFVTEHVQNSRKKERFNSEIHITELFSYCTIIIIYYI